MDKARDVTQDMLTRNADVDGIFACNATTAGGALTALQSFQTGRARRSRWSASMPGRWWSRASEKGDLDSLIIQNPYKMGYEGVKAIVRHLKGEQVPKEVDTGVELITADAAQRPQGHGAAQLADMSDSVRRRFLTATTSPAIRTHRPADDGHLEAFRPGPGAERRAV